MPLGGKEESRIKNREMWKIENSNEEQLKHERNYVRGFDTSIRISSHDAFCHKFMMKFTQMTNTILGMPQEQ